MARSNHSDCERAMSTILMAELSCTGLSAGGGLDKTETNRERNTDLLSNGAQESCTGGCEIIFCAFLPGQV